MVVYQGIRKQFAVTTCWYIFLLFPHIVICQGHGNPSTPEAFQWCINHALYTAEGNQPRTDIYICMCSHTHMVHGYVCFYKCCLLSFRFSELFAEIEERQEELGIIGFGVSMTTMDEVFFKWVPVPCPHVRWHHLLFVIPSALSLE